MATFELNTEGYWLDNNRDYMPNYSGIYFVCRGIYNTAPNTFDVNELLYIGKSEQEGGIRGRLANHEKRPQFQAACLENESICYACAELDEASLDIVENALVYAEQPILNDHLKDHFNYDEAIVKIGGNNVGLEHPWLFVKNDDIADIEEVDE